MRAVPLLPALTAVAVLALAGCASSPGDGPGEPISGASSLPDATPKEVPRSRYGNPDSYEVLGRRYHVMSDASGFRQRGIASWYGKKFHGRRTSSGEPYDMYAMTAAHKTLPLPSWVEVTNLDNGRKAVVKVNDRGPFAKGRIIDLSYAAATKLGVVSTGTAPVSIRVVGPGYEAGGKDAPPDGGQERQPDTARAVAVDDDTPDDGAVDGSAQLASAAGDDPQSLDGAVTADAGGGAGAARAPAEGAVGDTGDGAGRTSSASAMDYYIQLGAFGVRQNAERLMAQLRDSAIEVPVRMEATTQQGRELYRVRVGPLDGEAAVREIGGRLTAKGYPSGHVVTEP
ncbi:Endolytic peptidoglycan transglycosylase RlpA [wastewater metagenome]|uniref:Endolytic peptidoglycan transglycosylase RlpA n=2 Tax=unclassified sequences TaxID=12908 RepID=A0A5B8RAX2_9ZZZZ|nr:septal ring lytic transglycosylase RlpA family protein [Arhodomonas sp. KWT]QEA03895.1 endolytic peptidoglycan transglycosylase RlpA [uncultured organism]